MLAQQHPFKKNGLVNREMIRLRDPDYSPLRFYSSSAKSLIRAMLKRDPA